MSDPTTAVPAAAAAAAPPVELVNVQVDGVWMKFAKGTRMIKALEEAGLDRIMLQHHLFGDDDAVKLIAEEVLPAL